MSKNSKGWKQEIAELKSFLGDSLVLPVHHYQNKELVPFGDLVGDSYKLAVDCSRTTAENIVFCGVRFMAESARVLAGPDQRVFLPVTDAGCPMADMADIEEVEIAWKEIGNQLKLPFVPVVYMNSSVEIKDFCGRNGGAVCTSSNADKIVNYYLGQGRGVFFLPDYNLGKNTANLLGLAEEKIRRVSQQGLLEDGSEEASMLLWDGFCPVHQRFLPSDVGKARQRYPLAKVIVHPECDEKVVNLADAAGSTQMILNQISGSPEGSQWVVGTEAEFVERLARENPGKDVAPLRDTRCIEMQKIQGSHVCATLASLKEKTSMQEVLVDDAVKQGAAKALNAMIQIVEGKG
jgi:quinolinate synthase